MMGMNTPKKVMSKDVLAVGQVGTIGFLVSTTLMLWENAMSLKTTSNWLPGFL